MLQKYVSAKQINWCKVFVDQKIQYRGYKNINYRLIQLQRVIIAVLRKSQKSEFSPEKE